MKLGQKVRDRMTIGRKKKNTKTMICPTKCRNIDQPPYKPPNCWVPLRELSGVIPFLIPYLLHQQVYQRLLEMSLVFRLV